MIIKFVTKVWKWIVQFTVFDEWTTFAIHPRERLVNNILKADVHVCTSLQYFRIEYRLEEPHLETTEVYALLTDEIAQKQHWEMCLMLVEEFVVLYGSAERDFVMIAGAN